MMPASGLHDWAMPPLPRAEACEPLESGWGMPSDVGHADPQMAELLREVGVPQVMRGDFLQFTVPEFGFVAADLAELNQFIDELVFPVDMPRALVTSKIRLLWSHCQKAVVVASPKVERESTVASDVSANQNAGWGQAFPKKLSVDQVRDMKAKFIARYPTEPLAADTMPFWRWCMDRSWTNVGAQFPGSCASARSSTKVGLLNVLTKRLSWSNCWRSTIILKGTSLSSICRAQ